MDSWNRTSTFLELFTKFHKGLILKSKIITENFYSPRLGKQPIYKNNKLIDACVTSNKKQICLSVVNKSENKNVKLKSPYLKKIEKTYLINGENKTDKNNYKNLKKVFIQNNKLKINSEFITLPPHSINIILFKI